MSETPDTADRAPIAAGLDAFNDADRVFGGLWGWSYHGWLYVELLFIPEAPRGRGVGTEMLRAAERAAVARGCRGVWLDTFTFQAPGFYERLGCAALGTIPDHPTGHGRLIPTKRLRPGPSASDRTPDARCPVPGRTGRPRPPVASAPGLADNSAHRGRAA